jgi:hypothetical protein
MKYFVKAVSYTWELDMEYGKEYEVSLERLEEMVKIVDEVGGGYGDFNLVSVYATEMHFEITEHEC